MTDWESTTWGKVSDLLYGKALRKDDYAGGHVEVFGTNGPIGWHDSELFPEGVVVGRKGAYRGIHYAHGPCWVIDTAFYLRVDSNRLLDRWAYYALRNVDLNSIDSGSAIPSTTRPAFAAIPLRLPPLDSQQRQVQVLDAFDHLIENNRRRIKILEEMAQAIYREWFVHFRFPGHEDATFVDSPLGPIPEGWVPSTCGDELQVLGGGTPSKKEPAYWSDAEIAWYTPSDLTKAGARFAPPPETCINDLGLAKSSARLFPPGSVMMTSRATLGVLSISRTPATTNQGFIVIPPDDRWPSSFIFEWLSHKAEELEAIATGATFKEITKGAFKKVPFVVPTNSVLSLFRSTVEPIDDQIKLLLDETAVLTQLRDLLLPKLVTGKINVSNLDLDSLIGAAS